MTKSHLLAIIRLFCYITLFHFLLLSPTISKPFLVRSASLDHLPQLSVGDWVLRKGRILDSRIILELSHGKYSHIGMIIRTTPNIEVIHATTDDGGEKKEQVIVSPLAEFISPDLAADYLIIRPHFLTGEQKQLIASELEQLQGNTFILAPRNQPHLYCTTLLSEAIQHYEPHFAPSWQFVNTPLFAGEYLFPNAFERYPQTEIIYHTDFVP